MCTHTMSATTMPIHVKDGTYLQITFTKYDQYCLRIVGLNAQNTLFTYFPVKASERNIAPENLPQHVCQPWEVPFPNTKVIHEYLSPLDPIM